MAVSGQYPEIRTGQGLVPEVQCHSADGICLGTRVQDPVPGKRSGRNEILAVKIQEVHRILAMTSERPNVKPQGRYDTTQAAALLGVHRNTIRDWANKGLGKYKVTCPTIIKVTCPTFITETDPLRL